MTTNSHLSTTERKTKTTIKKHRLSKQLEQKQNHRNGDHMEGFQLVESGGRTWEKVQGIRSITVGTK